jgi:hypothetical protein
MKTQFSSNGPAVRREVMDPRSSGGTKTRPGKPPLNDPRSTR